MLGTQWSNHTTSTNLIKAPCKAMNQLQCLHFSTTKEWNHWMFNVPKQCYQCRALQHHAGCSSASEQLQNAAPASTVSTARVPATPYAQLTKYLQNCGIYQTL
jgi:hypothetical protein